MQSVFCHAMKKYICLDLIQIPKELILGIALSSSYKCYNFTFCISIFMIFFIFSLKIDLNLSETLYIKLFIEYQNNTKKLEKIC